MTETHLEELGRRHRSTKLSGDCLRRYSDWLESERDRVSNVVEIGVRFGQSVRMWAEYFPNAVIHGVDIDLAAKEHESDRIKVTIADSTDRFQIQRFLDGIYGEVEVAIDDGSHHPLNQIATLRWVFPQLSHGGVYLAEDIGGTRGHLRQRPLHAFKELVEGGNYWPKSFAAEQAQMLGDFDTDNYWIRTSFGVPSI